MHKVINEFALIDSEWFFIDLPSSAIELAIEGGPGLNEPFFLLPHKQALAHGHTHREATRIHTIADLSVVDIVEVFNVLSF
jgi:hypothetical protein